MTALFWTLCAASFLFFLVSLCRMALLFDSMLKRFRRDHPDKWERGGKANGFFWSPEGSGWLDSSLARGELLRSWRIEPPEWARADQELMSRFGKLATSWRLSGFAIGLYLVIFGLAIWMTYLRGTS